MSPSAAEYACRMNKRCFRRALAKKAASVAVATPVLLRAMLLASTAGVFTLPIAALAEVAAAQRVVQGAVSGAGDAALPGAVVYLKDLKTLSIRSFISTSDGSYRFGQMTNGADYELWADYKGKKSSVKTLSSFDNRKQTTVNLKVDAQ